MIPLGTFLCLYGYLAELDCSGVCVCELEQEETDELFRPCGPSTISDESSAIDFSFCRESSAVVEEVAPFFIESITRRSIPSAIYRSAERKNAWNG